MCASRLLMLFESRSDAYNVMALCERLNREERTTLRLLCIVHMVEGKKESHAVISIPLAAIKYLRILNGFGW